MMSTLSTTMPLCDEYVISTMSTTRSLCDEYHEYDKVPM